MHGQKGLAPIRHLILVNGVRSGMTWANTCPVPFSFQMQSRMTPAMQRYKTLKPAQAMAMHGYPRLRILRMRLHLPPRLLPSETV